MARPPAFSTSPSGATSVRTPPRPSRGHRVIVIGRVEQRSGTPRASAAHEVVDDDRPEPALGTLPADQGRPREGRVESNDEPETPARRPSSPTAPRGPTRHPGSALGAPHVAGVANTADDFALAGVPPRRPNHHCGDRMGRHTVMHWSLADTGAPDIRLDTAAAATAAGDLAVGVASRWSRRDGGGQPALGHRVGLRRRQLGLDVDGSTTADRRRHRTAGLGDHAGRCH